MGDFVYKMNFFGLFFSLLLIHQTVSEPPSFVACADVEAAFAPSGLDWKCEGNGEKLGEGASGFTVLLKDKNGRKAICKVMEYKVDDPTDQAANELKVLEVIKGLPNIIDVYETRIVNFGDKGNVAMILQEYAEFGNLFDYQESNDELFKNPRNALKIVAGIINGVKQMHEKNWIHGDLKTENVVLDDKLVPKLIDFDLSNENGKPGALKGTPSHVDPRILEGTLKKYDEKVDVYSLGVIIYEMTTKMFPFWEDDLDDLVLALRVGTYMIPRDMELTVAIIVAKCLQVDPGNRPTLDQLAKMVDDYLKSPQDRLVTKKFLRNKSIPEESEFSVKTTVNRADDVKTYLAGKNQRNLLIKDKPSPPHESEGFLPLALIVELLVLFLVFTALMNWVDRIRNQPNSEPSVDAFEPKKTDQDTTTVAMDPTSSTA